METVKFLCLVIHDLDAELKNDELTVEERVNKLHVDIAMIAKHIKDRENK